MAIKTYPDIINERALLIEWNQNTGERAGNINPNDVKLQCYGWQNMEITPAIELRLVEDNRDISQYKNIDGIKILNGIKEINAAIDENFPEKYSIEDELIYEEHVKQEIGNNNIILNNLPDDRTERLKKLQHEFGIKGIKKTEPLKV